MTGSTRGPRARPGDAASEVILDQLTHGALTVRGQLPWSSNATFLVDVAGSEPPMSAVYKPRRGERPLWDFPSGTLHKREAAAYVVSHALGWGLVPETVVRAGPLGEGAVQRFIPHDPERHYLTLERPDPEVVARIVAFDIVVNNADRKSGHVLEDPDGHLWCIDHGVTFHVEPKLRTVIWDLGGTALPRPIAADLRRLAGELRRDCPLAAALAPLLSAAEIRAVDRRLARLLEIGTFPEFDPDSRSVPWPPV